MKHHIEDWDATPQVAVNLCKEVGIAGQAADMRFVLNFDTTAEHPDHPWVIQVYGLKDIHTNKWEVWDRRLTNMQAAALMYLFVAGDDGTGTETANCYAQLEEVLQDLPQHLRIIP